MSESGLPHNTLRLDSLATQISWKDNQEKIHLITHSMLNDRWHSCPVLAIESPAFKNKKTLATNYDFLLVIWLWQKLKGAFSHIWPKGATITPFIQDVFLFDGDFTLLCWTGGIQKDLAWLCNWENPPVSDTVQEWDCNHSGDAVDVNWIKQTITTRMV